MRFLEENDVDYSCDLAQLATILNTFHYSSQKNVPHIFDIGVPASGCDTASLSYLIYNALFMPPFCESSRFRIKEVHGKYESSKSTFLNLFHRLYSILCPFYEMFLRSIKNA